METRQKKALVFQHAEHETPGRLGELMRRNGFEIRTVHFASGDRIAGRADDFSLLVVMGGPMGVYENDKYPWLAEETEFTRRFIGSGRPVIGICLGAQIMAAALGAKVFRGKSKEIGWYEVEPAKEAAADPLFSAFSGRRKIFQWHGDTFEIPDGAVRLASSGDFPNQAFRYGGRAYALQFHLETDAKMARDWLAKERNKQEIKQAGLNLRRIESETGIYSDDMEKLADAFFGAFLKMV